MWTCEFLSNYFHRLMNPLSLSNALNIWNIFRRIFFWVIDLMCNLFILCFNCQIDWEIMPFSIKRLTQVHRSTSLPSKNKHDDKDKKNKSSKAEPSSSSQSSQSNVGPNKQKLSQLPGSRSIDAAEIRRLGGQLTISSPIPIDQPPGNTHFVCTHSLHLIIPK